MTDRWRLARATPSSTPERMDGPDPDPDLLRRALDGLDLVHRLTGGARLAASPLRRASRSRPGPRLRLLDVGTGGGRLAIEISDRLRASGAEVRPVLADLRLRTLELARELTSPDRGARRPDGAAPVFVRLTGTALPFPTDSVDVALCTTTLHHLELPEAVACLEELDRVAGGRWVVTDLRRSHLALAAVRALSSTLWRRNPYPRHDGPVSVRRAFTPRELEGLLAEAGLTGARVDRRGPVRLRAVGGGIP